MEEDKTLNLELDIVEVQKVINALAELPAKEVIELIGKIQMQAQSQLQPPEED